MCAALSRCVIIGLVPDDQMMTGPRLLAISDLHVGYQENREVVERIRPVSASDWLVVAGDVGEQVSDVRWALGTLRERFAKVVWVPGNHELWTHRRDPVQLRGQDLYLHLVDLCQEMGVLTPEDPFPVWHGDGGPVVIAPLFVLYDYTFRPEGASTKAEGLELAFAAGVVCTDELWLFPDPYPTREAWCRARLAVTERRLAGLPAGARTVLVNHFPLVREPTRVLRYPQFAQWCGTTATADWPVRYNAVAVIYGHLHIPRTTWHDGIRHEEVSLGYPREWRGRTWGGTVPRQILPAVASAAAA